MTDTTFDPFEVLSRQLAEAEKVLPGIGGDGFTLCAPEARPPGWTPSADPDVILAESSVCLFNGTMVDDNKIMRKVKCALIVPTPNSIILTDLSLDWQWLGGPTGHKIEGYHTRRQYVLQGTLHLDPKTRLVIAKADGEGGYIYQDAPMLRSDLKGQSLSLSFEQMGANLEVAMFLGNFLETECSWERSITKPKNNLPENKSDDEDGRHEVFALVPPVANQNMRANLRTQTEARIKHCFQHGPFVQSAEIGQNINPDKPDEGYYNILRNFQEALAHAKERQLSKDPVRMAATNYLPGSLTGNIESAPVKGDNDKMVVRVRPIRCRTGRMTIGGLDLDFWTQNPAPAPAAPAEAPAADEVM